MTITPPNSGSVEMSFCSANVVRVRFPSAASCATHRHMTTNGVTTEIDTCAVTQWLAWPRPWEWGRRGGSDG